MLKKVFGFDSTKHKLRTEIIAGLTTFLAMAYILAINPAILSETGMDEGALFTSTALASAIATIIIAIFAKMPLAQAPSMGINAFFAYTLVGAMGYSWQTALTITFIEGILFILLTAFNIREKIVRAIPRSLNIAIPAGIGLFIAFIGLQNGDVIVDNPATLVAQGDFGPTMIISLVGIVLCGVFMQRNVKGALFVSIIICTIIALVTGVTTLPEGFSPISTPSSIEPILWKFDFTALLNPDVIIMILLLAFMDIFNTLGTLIGAAKQADMFDKDGNIPHAKEALMSDAIGTTVGAAMGCSTITTFVESSAGIAEGGRTGITAFTTGVMFLLALFLAPLFTLIPLCALTGTLVTIGVIMLGSIKEINFDRMSEAIPAFLTVIIMMLSYSIAEGISMGIISHTLINLLSKKGDNIGIPQYIITLILILRYFYIYA